MLGYWCRGDLIDVCRKNTSISAEEYDILGNILFAYVDDIIVVSGQDF